MVKLTQECSLCGSRHWCGRSGCRGAHFLPQVGFPIGKAATPDGEAVSSTTYEYRDPDARRAYQRDYQRERRKRKAEERAAAREKKAVSSCA